MFTTAPAPDVSAAPPASTRGGNAAVQFAEPVSPLELRPLHRLRPTRPAAIPQPGPHRRFARPAAPRDVPVVSDSDRTDQQRGCAALAGTGVASIASLRLQVAEQQVCVAGVVGSYYHKQLVTESLRPVLAGRRLINQVSVR